MISQLLEIYTLVVIADVILSYLPQFKGHQIVKYINKATDLTCGPVRKLLSKVTPPNLRIDFAPLVVIVAIKLIEVLW